MLRFENILDHKEPIAWLRRAFQTDRLPHGLIFAGPAGVGKGTTATVFLPYRPLGTENLSAVSLRSDIHQTCG